MGKVYDAIDDKIRQWVEQQKMFFVATAPLSGDGLVNCSPKGMDSFRILGPTTVAYLDLTGSGVETIAHLKENGRIVVMFCAFEGSPKIMRFHGKGVVHELGSEGYAELLPQFEDIAGARSIIVVDVKRISDSCGWGVPLYDYQADRDTLRKASEKEGPDGMVRYRNEKNLVSLDGLPGFPEQQPATPEKASDEPIERSGAQSG
ncbi:pyridoxamine 5'-phosphate oxidase family protein [Cerasicoccus frondis]|uniref:pyridoxamine 5'-phosphate oxidase family protein n=1 Tax=Cerasicoccus frondis TaxID=490090 RepID=UPI002852649A|nr:pyridoxamine 5'-phosphate oxidase family protein [Cerasicoccus frondis]